MIQDSVVRKGVSSNLTFVISFWSFLHFCWCFWSVGADINAIVFRFDFFFGKGINEGQRAASLSQLTWQTHHWHNNSFGGNMPLIEVIPSHRSSWFISPANSLSCIFHTIFLFPSWAPSKKPYLFPFFQVKKLTTNDTRKTNLREILETYLEISRKSYPPHFPSYIPP